jgi:hypothetical protein
VASEPWGEHLARARRASAPSDPTKDLWLRLRTYELLRPTTVVAAAAVVLLLLGLPTIGAAPAEALPQGCAEELPAADYTDRDEISAAHLDAVDCVTQLGIAQGLGSDVGEVYLPHAEVRRDQMATFIVGLLTEAGVALPVAEDPPFEDVSSDDVHAESIAKLAAAGIVSGVGDDRYEPAAQVRRDQMASFLIPSLAYQAAVEVGDLQGGDLPFSDVAEGNVHRASIAGAFNVGITSGTSTDTYSPASSVSREAMASFVVRTLEAMNERVTVADRDGGALPHTVYTLPRESGRCFQVTAGTAWQSVCEPASDERLQLRPVRIDGDFTVVAGLVTAEVSRVAIEYDDGASIDVDLTPTGSDGLQAWASPILAADIDVASHGTYDRAVFEVAGDATIRLDLTNMAYPIETDLETYEPGTRLAGADAITEIYVGTTFEGITRLFLGLPAETPFRAFGLEDPSRVVVDVFHETVE